MDGVPVDLDVKVAVSGYKRKVPEGKAKRQREEGEEVKSPKRKVIRVESEETQDYVTRSNRT